MLILSRKAGDGFRVGDFVFEVMDIDPDLGVLFRYRPRHVPHVWRLVSICYEDRKALPEADIALYAYRLVWPDGRVARNQARIGIEAPRDVDIVRSELEQEQ